VKTRAKALSSLVMVGLLLVSPSAAVAVDSNRSFAKVLSDHPGAATALTAEQKQEIESVVAKSAGNRHLVCTGVSLSGQRESMYRVVRLRAQLVCDYAKSLNPALKTVVQESFTPADQFNGRVVVVSR
jgi:hypothetical protein